MGEKGNTGTKAPVVPTTPASTPPAGQPPEGGPRDGREQGTPIHGECEAGDARGGGTAFRTQGEAPPTTPRMTAPTELPGFNPRVPPLKPTQLAQIWRAPMKRERGGQTYREPDSYPEPPAETPEERRVEAQRAQREQEWALDTQSWTTTECGLGTEGDSNVPQTEWGMVSPIQCLACATYRIPALRFCYQCFNNIAVNHLIRTTNASGSHQYRCRMCFIEKRTRALIYQHLPALPPECQGG